MEVYECVNMITSKATQTRAASLRREREHFGVVKKVLVGDTVTLTGNTSSRSIWLGEEEEGVLS